MYSYNLPETRNAATIDLAVAARDVIAYSTMDTLSHNGDPMFSSLDELTWDVIVPVCIYYGLLNKRMRFEGPKRPMADHKNLRSYIAYYLFARGDNSLVRGKWADKLGFDSSGFPSILRSIYPSLPVHADFAQDDVFRNYTYLWYVLNITRDSQDPKPSDISFFTDITSVTVNKGLLKKTLLDKNGVFYNFVKEFLKGPINRSRKNPEVDVVSELYPLTSNAPTSLELNTAAVGPEEGADRSPDIVRAIRPILSLNSGPNTAVSGLCAMESAPLDALAILAGKDDLSGKSVYRHLDKVCSTLKTRHIMDLIHDSAKSEILDHAGRNASEDKYYHSRILVLPNQENKARVVAQGDCFTQMVLYPVHTFLKSVSRNIHMSYMEDQVAGIELLKELTANPDNLPVGMDATAMTDRFSIEPQRVVLRCLLGDDELADDLLRLMVDREFVYTTPDRVDHTLRYNQGQGMGIY